VISVPNSHICVSDITFLTLSYHICRPRIYWARFDSLPWSITKPVNMLSLGLGLGRGVATLRPGVYEFDKKYSRQ